MKLLVPDAYDKEAQCVGVDRMIVDLNIWSIFNTNEVDQLSSSDFIQLHLYDRTSKVSKTSPERLLFLWSWPSPSLTIRVRDDSYECKKEKSCAAELF